MDTAQAKAPEPMYEWITMPWKRFERQVFKLQKRIYQASSRGDVKTLHRLQRLLMRSRAARCLAVRRVSQDNQGKQTAGVDGVKSLDPAQRFELAQVLRPSPKAQPTRRVWIPKPGKTERRPLGIPTIRDRASQALVKLALEPEWEARFEPNSFGFRPGRSCHDAIEAIFSGVCKKPKYVLDADIAKCFDRIDHQALLQKLGTYPTLRRVIKAWLKAGVMEGGALFPTEAGTPQGGVISPLLANVALHGLETAIRDSIKGHHRGQDWKPIVVRYADDFVVMHQDLAVIERLQEFTSAWLKDMGLELKPSKTKITHTLVPHNGNCGFDFLGFQVRQFPVGKTHSGKLSHRHCESTLLGFKTIISPSQEAMRRHNAALGDVLHAHKMAPQSALISRLNPTIRGWSNYYATVCSKDAFAKMDHQLYLKLRAWARYRHHDKPRHWIARKYWRLERGSWVFAEKVGPHLLRHDKTPIERHIKVQGTRSPFDGDWVYWASRLGRHPELPTRVAMLLRRQRGRCAYCGLFFKDGDLPEVDHIIPTSRGGADEYRNWQLLHRHCHDEKTTGDGSVVRGAK